jgi:uroporphyrinogen-III synthase
MIVGKLTLPLITLRNCVMKILITRSSKENLYLEKYITSKVENASVDKIDMIRYKQLDVDLSKFHLENKRIICTSKFCSEILSKSINNYCEALVVGDESGNILSKNKFITKIQTFINVQNLKQNIDFSEKQKYLYLSGNVISEDIPNIERKEIYNVEYKYFLNNEEIQRIRQANVILFFSENTTKSFINLLNEHKINDYIKEAFVVGISKKSVLPIENMVKKILYSKNHSKDEIIDILNEIKYCEFT